MVDVEPVLGVAGRAGERRSIPSLPKLSLAFEGHPVPLSDARARVSLCPGRVLSPLY